MCYNFYVFLSLTLWVRFYCLKKSLTHYFFALIKQHEIYSSLNFISTIFLAYPFLDVIFSSCCVYMVATRSWLLFSSRLLTILKWKIGDWKLIHTEIYVVSLLSHELSVFFRGAFMTFRLRRRKIHFDIIWLIKKYVYCCEMAI